MRRFQRWVSSSVAIAILIMGGSAELAAANRQARVAPVMVTGVNLPIDLTHPEGKTRWDLTGLDLSGDISRSLESSGETRDMMRMGARQTVEQGEPGVQDSSGAFMEIETVGIGWVHLPAGPREVVLQRLVTFEGNRPDRLAHRWVDPEGGVVAEVSGPATPDGSARLGVDAAFVTRNVAAAAATLKIYSQELETPVGFAIGYGRDRGNGTTVASLTPQGYTTIGQLAAADTWDFSGNTTGLEIASYSVVPITAAETCNAARCGYNLPGLELTREDKGFTDTDPNNNSKINTVTELEQRAGDVTIWLRAGAQKEGTAGSLGNGESRFCHVTDGTGTRTPVPLWRFPNQDAGGWYMQAGDPNWGTPVFNCVQNLYNEVCGGGGAFSTLYAKNCTGGGGHSGTQWGQVVKGGVVMTPSGHTFNALLVRNVADFCAYLSSACGFPVSQVRTVNYIWQVPWIGTVARLQSETNAPDLTSYTTLLETDFKFGLFPPRSITVGTVGSTSVSLSWDPGTDTHRINAYRLYWDTDPGASTTYAFNSLANPGQVSFNGTSATISGLTPGTTYYFTVTSRSNNTNASTGAITTYESLLYPTQVSGDPAFIYPTEVQARTTSPTCIPTQQPDNVSVTHASGSDIQICWDASTDPCTAGYQVLGGTAADSDATFAPVADTSATCMTGNPSGTFFLVTVKGTGGDGPWGHYGR